MNAEDRASLSRRAEEVREIARRLVRNLTARRSAVSPVCRRARSW
jgi:hypothetical protein